MGGQSLPRYSSPRATDTKSSGTPPPPLGSLDFDDRIPSNAPSRPFLTDPGHPHLWDIQRTVDIDDIGFLLKRKQSRPSAK